MNAGPADVKFTDVNNDGELDIVSSNVNWEDRGLSVIMQGNCEGDDCNNNGIGDICELPDCNFNGITDECDIASGASFDYDLNGEPDECQLDCNENGIPDFFEIEKGFITDCNNNGIPDDCDWINAGDCDDDGVIDACEQDANYDQVPDDCQCIADLSGNGTVEVNDLLQLIAAWGDPGPHPDSVPEDLNGDMVVDVADLLIVIGAWGDCSKYTLPNITGACCGEFFCVERQEVACEILLGTYFGDNTTCDSVDCGSP
jgi:hypothetical protein